MADSAFDKFVAGLPADYFRSESEKDIARVAFAVGVTVGAFGVVAGTARAREDAEGAEARCRKCDQAMRRDGKHRICYVKGDRTLVLCSFTPSALTADLNGVLLNG